MDYSYLHSKKLLLVDNGIYAAAQRFRTAAGSSSYRTSLQSRTPRTGMTVRRIKAPSRSSLDVPLEEKPHYMKSTDERLDLGHGLGLLLVRQIAEAHGGIMKMENRVEGGVEAALVFTCCCHQNENQKRSQARPAF